MEVEQAQAIEEWFPIQDEKESKYNYGLNQVPFEFMLEHEQQALKNHGQPIKRLAERGGLSARETILVITDQSLERLDEINWDNVNPHATINHELARWYQKKLASQDQKIAEQVKEIEMLRNVTNAITFGTYPELEIRLHIEKLDEFDSKRLKR